MDKELSDELLERITTLDYSYNIPVRYIRVMAAELLEYRKKDGDWRSRIPWDMIDPTWVAVAKDESGKCFLYDHIPSKRSIHWGTSDCVWSLVLCFTLIPDSVPWDDSLAIRPGYAEDKQ